MAEARQHAEALVAERTAEAARAASQAKDDEWSAKLEASRKEWEQRLERELDQQQTQADDHLLEEMARLRGELEEAAARAVAERDAALKQELQSSFQDDLRRDVELAPSRIATGASARTERCAVERSKANTELDAVRANLQHDLDTERTRHAAEIAAERDRASSLTIDLERARAAAAELENSQRRAAELTNALAAASRERDDARAAVAERQAQPAMSAAQTPSGAGEATVEFAERLLAAIRDDRFRPVPVRHPHRVDDGRRRLRAAAAVLIVQGGDAQVWRAAGIHAPGNQAAAAGRSHRQGRLHGERRFDDCRDGPRVRCSFPRSVRVGRAGHGRRPERRSALCRRRDGGRGAGERATWPGAMQVLAAHASTCLSQITASRTSQALQASRAGGVETAPAADDESSARRYARLLVSEIKLYNESAVRLGREKRDLLARLRPEIDRARHLFEERVSPSIARRSAFFHDELVHTLADGDSALLGSA